MSDRIIGYLWLATMLLCLISSIVAKQVVLYEIALSGFVGFAIGTLCRK